MRRDASLNIAVSSSVLRIRNVGRRLGERTVWVESLDVPRGKVVVIIGASGSGKSSLLHLLGGLSLPDYRQDQNSFGALSEQPALEACFSFDDRQVLFDLCKGPATKSFHDRVGFVFQSAYLLQSASASANMALGAYSASRSIEPGTLLHLAGALSIDPRFLAERTSARSGGERQRIAVARAFARAPNLIIADEPTASLDPKLAEEIIGYLGEWSDPSTDRTTIWATHDVHLAAKFSDYVIVLKDGRLPDWATWPQENPRDPSVLRQWIDSEASSGRLTDPARAYSRSEHSRASPAAREQVLTKSGSTEVASRWARLLFWQRSASRRYSTARGSTNSTCQYNRLRPRLQTNRLRPPTLGIASASMAVWLNSGRASEPNRQWPVSRCLSL